MSSRGVLILISAKTCGHCKRLYDSYWPEITSEVKSLGGIEIVEIKLETTSSPLDTTKYPAGLNKYLRWYPMLLLVPTANYQQALRDKDTKIDGYILNGKLTDTGVADFVNAGYSMDKAGIMKWINDTLAKPQFNSKPPVPTTSSIKPLVQSGRGKLIIPQGGDVCSGLVVKGW